MNHRFTKIVTSLFISVFCVFLVAHAQTERNNGLTAEQKTIVPIAAFTASGNLSKLKSALIQGLDAGLTINEIKEILVQMYAYAGFPRSLNGIMTFMDVLDEREQKGIKDTPGKEATPLPSDKTSIELGSQNQTRLTGKLASGRYIEFAPAIDRFLKGHLFGDIFGRDILDFQTREIATLSALANMEGLNPQLLGHFKASLNIGLTQAQITDLISVIESRVGKKQADNAREVFNGVVNNELSSSPQQTESVEQKIIVTQKKSLLAMKGSADNFTGAVDIDTLFKAPAPSNFGGGRVAFEPGARTAWHTHELGQLLIVTSGTGMVQSWGGEVQEIREGDVVWIPPHQKHWHGAATNTPMTHIAIVEYLNGNSAQWMEKVSDEQYGL
jgi:4-carboxymuconolactone decarboxylase